MKIILWNILFLSVSANGRSVQRSLCVAFQTEFTFGCEIHAPNGRSVKLVVIKIEYFLSGLSVRVIFTLTPSALKIMILSSELFHSAQ